MPFGRDLFRCAIAVFAVSASARGQSVANPTVDLLTAARKGDVAGIRGALAAGAGANDADPNFAQTALIRAAMFGQRAAAEALLAQRADPNRAGHGGRTALHWAAVSGAAEIATALAQAGATVDAKDVDGETPLGLAADAAQPGAVRALLAVGARADNMNRGIARRVGLVLGNRIGGAEADALVEIIRSGRGLEVREDVRHRTPLLEVAEHANAPDAAMLARALLAAGATRAAKDDTGKTSLQIVTEWLAIEKDPARRANIQATLAALR